MKESEADVLPGGGDAGRTRWAVHVHAASQAARGRTDAVSFGSRRGLILFRKALAKVRTDRSITGAAGLVRDAARSKVQSLLDATVDCTRLIETGEYDEAIRWLKARLKTTHPADRHLRLSLLLVEALFKGGRAQEARTALESAEETAGPSFQTRLWRARLHSFAGRAQAALDASTQAQLDPEAREWGAQPYRRLRRMRAEALCALGRPDDAFRFLCADAQAGVPDNADLAALRRTVQTPAAVEAFLAALSPWLHKPGLLSIAPLHQFSMACRDNGMMDGALSAARQRFLTGVKASSFGHNPPLPQRNWQGLAVRALRDLKAGLDGMGVEFFLISGTLLGCVRENRILAHDKDMDVGVFSTMEPAFLRKALSELGQFKVRPLRTDRMIQIEHANGVLTDIFLHWKEDGLVLHEGQKARWWNTPFSLQETRFLGDTFNIPTSPETYLAENYGEGWAKPDRNFETFTDTPNMVPADRQHMAWYFLTRLYDYFQWGKPVQFAKAWRGLQAFHQPDPVLQAAAERAIALTFQGNAA